METLLRYWPITLLLAALLEVVGDFIVRQGVRPFRWWWFLFGGATLAFYGLAVNLLRWDFGKLLGVYVVVFAAVAVGWGYCYNYFFPDEKANLDDPNFYRRALWGLLFILVGGVIMSWPEIKKLGRVIASDLGG